MDYHEQRRLRYIFTIYSIKRLLNPEIFQGRNKKGNYFEGWYYKIIDSKMENAFAVIPGISYGINNEESHAFVQVLDAHKCNVNYIRYNISDFKFDKDRFEIEISNNYFSDKEIRLSIAKDHFTMNGRLAFTNIIAYPKTILRPGIMGPYSFVPFMECHHGIINMHHEITGQLNISERETDFSNGYGYIEKDWGTSFPEAWIWLQSNHFDSDDVTLMFSLAKIPWLGRFFWGLISFIRIKEKIYTFATYTGTKITRLDYSENRLIFSLKDKKYKMDVEARHKEGGILKAPKNGMMQNEITESITAEIRVRLSDTKGKLVYEGKGTHAGLEIANESIFTYFKAKR